MKVLELFAGSCSFSDVAKEFGHKTFTVDNGLDLLTKNQYKKIDLVKDIMDFTIDDISFSPDIIWASPPCTTFSIASCSTHWTAPDEEGLRIPKTNDAELGLYLLEQTVWIMNKLQPKYYVIENPRDSSYTLDGNMQSTSKNSLSALYKREPQLNNQILFEYNYPLIFFAEESLEMQFTAPYFLNAPHLKYGAVTQGQYLSLIQI